MQTLQVGISRRIITPTVPVSLAGYFSLRYWDRILDDLYVHALAFRQGERTAVLLQFDLLRVTNEMIAGIRLGTADVPSLAPQDILFTASHTHTAPQLFSEREGGNPDYTNTVIAEAVHAIHEACENLAPATLSQGKASDDRFAFNRRYWMKDGTVVTNPPRLSPDIAEPEGPIDPEIGLLGFLFNGELRILLANIVNHPDTTEGCAVSADWHGHVRRALEEKNPNLTVVTITGASGNINHFNPNSGSEQSGPEIARRIGEGYAETISKALPGMKPLASQTLALATATFKTGPREIDEEKLAEAREHIKLTGFDEGKQLTSEDLAAKNPAALKHFAKNYLAVAADRREKSIEIRALRLGNAVIVNLPGEPFTEIGLTIKNEYLAGQPAFVATLNQDIGYIPNRCNFGRGGYETTANCSPYSMETAPLLLQATKKMLENLPEAE